MSKAFLTVQGISKDGRVSLEHSPAADVTETTTLAARVVRRYRSMGWEDVPVTGGKYTHLRQRFRMTQGPGGEPLYEHRMFLVIPLPGE